MQFIKVVGSGEQGLGRYINADQVYSLHIVRMANKTEVRGGAYRIKVTLVDMLCKEELWAALGANRDWSNAYAAEMALEVLVSDVARVDSPLGGRLT